MSDQPDIDINTIKTKNNEPIGFDRITFYEIFYHQQAFKDPLQIETRFTQDLKLKSQPWIRELTIEESSGPTKLNYGWIDNPGTILIVRPKKRRSVIPSKEEVEEARKSILFVGYSDSEKGEYIFEGGSKRLNPSHPNDLIVKSLKGSIDFILYAFTE